MAIAARGDEMHGRVVGWLRTGIALAVVAGLGCLGAALWRPSGALGEVSLPNAPLPDAVAVRETAGAAAFSLATAVNHLRVHTYVTAAARAAEDKARHDGVWEAMARCETGGNWSMRGSRFSGGVGFANSTWVAYGGRDFAPNAGQASRDEQIVVAERVRTAHGYDAWGCADSIGLG